MRPRIVIAKRILKKVNEDVHNYPDTEVGGRWVGRFIPAGDNTKTKQLSVDPIRNTFVILDYLPMGPAPKKSTAVELQPDREYQLWTLRRLQDADASIEPLGSWHSHIPNGLTRFSGVDLSSYHSKLNNPNSPWPYDGIVCSLIYDNPSSNQDVINQLHHAWFPSNEELGVHEWIDDEIIWIEADISRSDLLDINDFSAYLNYKNSITPSLDDWIRAIDRVSSMSGHYGHQIKKHPSGEKIILIEEYDDGEKFIVEINASGKAILHIDSDGFSNSTEMNSVEDAMSEFELRIKLGGGETALWSHVNTTLALSLRPEDKKLNLIGKILNLFNIK